MGHKEYGVTDILDILRRLKAKDSQRRISRATGIDPKTIRSYLRIATMHGFADTVPDDELAEIASAVIREVYGNDNRNSEPGACATGGDVGKLCKLLKEKSKGTHISI